MQSHSEDSALGLEHMNLGQGTQFSPICSLPVLLKKTLISRFNIHDNYGYMFFFNLKKSFT